MSPSWANHLSPDWPHPGTGWWCRPPCGESWQGPRGVSCLRPHFEAILIARSQIQTHLALLVLLGASLVSVLLGMPVGVLPRDEDSGLPRAWQWCPDPEKPP